MEERPDRSPHLKPHHEPRLTATANPAHAYTSPARPVHPSATPPADGPSTTPPHFRPGLVDRAPGLHHGPRPVERNPRLHQPLQGVTQSSSRRIYDCQVKQPGRPSGWSFTALALPRIQPDMVVIPARGEERRLVAKSLCHIKSKHPVVELECPLQVRHLQVNVSHPGASVNRALAHAD